jgi:hypothetical protein
MTWRRLGAEDGGRRTKDECCALLWRAAECPFIQIDSKFTRRFSWSAVLGNFPSLSKSPNGHGDNICNWDNDSRRDVSLDLIKFRLMR